MWALCPNTGKCSITSLQFQVRHAMMLYEPCHQLCSAYWCMIAAEMAKREGRRTPQRHRLHLSTKSAQSLMSVLWLPVYCLQWVVIQWGGVIACHTPGQFVLNLGIMGNTDSLVLWSAWHVVSRRNDLTFSSYNCLLAGQVFFVMQPQERSYLEASLLFRSNRFFVVSTDLLNRVLFQP